MKRGAMKLAVALLIPVAAFAQMRDNRDKDLSCQSWNYGNWNQSHHCDMREQTIASAGRITADPARNGGVTVKGWLRNDILIRSRVDAWADSESEAAAMVNQVRIDTTNGTISAAGPSGDGRRGWSVSFEIFVPRKTAVSATTHNGGISVSDVDGAIQLETNNGGIALARVAGDVSGTTRNGGVAVELAGAKWQGRQLDLNTQNGGITVSVPQNYSAHIQAETVNGRVSSDLPVTVSGWLRHQVLDGQMGSGGPLIHVRTVNGGISLRRS